MTDLVILDHKYKAKFGSLSLMLLNKNSNISDGQRELLGQQFCLATIISSEGRVLSLEEKVVLFDRMVEQYGLEKSNNMLSDIIVEAKGEYPNFSNEIFEQLFEKAIGEIGLNIKDFYTMSPHEIDLAYRGYLSKKQLEANCFLIALRKSQDDKAFLISLLGGDGYTQSTQTERELTFKTLGIE